MSVLSQRMRADAFLMRFHAAYVRASTTHLEPCAHAVVSFEEGDRGDEVRRHAHQHRRRSTRSTDMLGASKPLRCPGDDRRAHSLGRPDL
eukprot:1101354-Pleurochrysis_carterae.AAC.1